MLHSIEYQWNLALLPSYCSQFLDHSAECFSKAGFKKSESEYVECADENESEYDQLSLNLSKKLSNFDKYAYRCCDDLVPAGETYNDSLVLLKQSELTEEPEQDESTPTEHISKEKVLDALSLASTINYFLNSSDYCKNEVNSILWRRFIL